MFRSLTHRGSSKKLARVACSLFFCCWVSLLCVLSVAPEGLAAAQGEIGAVSFEKVAPEGFGRAANVGFGDAALFKGCLYLSTRTFPQGEGAEQVRAEIWRTADGLSWTEVGKEDLASSQSFCFHLLVFADSLYAIGDTRGNVEIWVSNDGVSFRQVKPGAFPPPNQAGKDATVQDTAVTAAVPATGSAGTRAVSPPGGSTVVTYPFVFAKKLVMAVAGYSRGLSLLVSDDGKVFKPVSAGNLLAPGNIALVVDNPQQPSAVLDDALYVGVTNPYVGGQIWCSKDAVNWVEVAGNGLGKQENVTLRPELIFRGYLYAVSEPAGSLRSPSHFDVFRTCDGTNWEKVIADGFGEQGFKNVYGWLTVFHDTLYLTAQALPASSASSQPGAVARSNAFRLYTSTDGNSWIQSGCDGFGSQTAFWASMRVVGGAAFLIVHDTEKGLSLWTSPDGNSWRPVFSDSRPAATANEATLLLFMDHLFLVRDDVERGVCVWRSREPLAATSPTLKPASSTTSVFLSTTIKSEPGSQSTGRIATETSSPQHWPVWATITGVVAALILAAAIAVRVVRGGRENRRT